MRPNFTLLDAESNMELLDLMSIPAASDWLERINL
jgi:hypothetical protein